LKNTVKNTRKQVSELQAQNNVLKSKQLEDAATEQQLNQLIAIRQKHIEDQQLQITELIEMLNGKRIIQESKIR
jgi:septal ring factor EnvC (AmiA/AmiB activator)